MSHSLPGISLLILTRDREQSLIELLKSLVLSQAIRYFPGPLEIIVLDNASSIYPERAVRQFESASKTYGFVFRFIREENNWGCAQGRNRIARFASNQYLVFIDDDCIVADPLFFYRITRLFDEYPDVGIIAFPGYEPEFNRVWVPHKRKSYLRKPVFYTYFFWGSLHAIRRQVWEQVGGYSPEITDRGEEYDLAYKVISAGWKILFTSETFLIHKPAVQGRQPPRQVHLNHSANRIVIAWKYLPIRYVFTHAIMWSLYAVKQTRDPFALFELFKLVRDKLTIATRKPLDTRARLYLKQVNARLWY